MRAQRGSLLKTRLAGKACFNKVKIAKFPQGKRTFLPELAMQSGGAIYPMSG